MLALLFFHCIKHLYQAFNSFSYLGYSAKKEMPRKKQSTLSEPLRKSRRQAGKEPNSIDKEQESLKQEEQHGNKKTTAKLSKNKNEKPPPVTKPSKAQSERLEMSIKETFPNKRARADLNYLLDFEAKYSELQPRLQHFGKRVKGFRRGKKKHKIEIDGLSNPDIALEEALTESASSSSSSDNLSDSKEKP